MLLDKINLPKDLRKLPKEQMSQVCKELRNEIINIISKTGGHLGAGLGVIELTVALHYIFNTPKDKLIWDVGHQTYPHKILTGRKNKMQSVRQKDGLSGFTKRNESEYDAFGAGHSSTSISAAVGMAIARDLERKSHDIIAIIGDGAMSAGMAYEAMNNAGHLNSKIIVILNDNDMSIAPAIGALSNYLVKLIASKPYLSLRDKTKHILEGLPDIFHNSFKKAEQKARGLVRDVAHGNNLFEDLGFYYIGPLDGHNVDDLISIFENIKDCDINKPILIHTITKKGYGYQPAENSSDKFHGVSKFDIPTGKQNKSNSNIASYTKIFANELTIQAKNDKKIVAITAAMPDGTGLNEFSKEHPDKFFDVGIAEQHAVTFAAGLACEGFKPFVTIYSTFLQRAYDQIVHDVAIQNLPVKFAIDRAGYVGADGPTHAGSFDIAFLCNLPNFIVMAASDEQELMNMVATAASHNRSPIAFRYPRGNVTGLKITKSQILEIGKSRTIQEGKEIAILSFGARLEAVKKASDKFMKKNKFKPTIIDMRFAKPLDNTIIKKIIKTHKKIITIEEGAIGGFSNMVSNFLLNNNLLENIIFNSITFPDKFLDQASPDEMYAEAEMDENAIYKILEKIKI
jgi:1-deoxy-D-xylulose-5-phosphate synthase